MLYAKVHSIWHTVKLDQPESAFRDNTLLWTKNLPYTYIDLMNDNKPNLYTNSAQSPSRWRRQQRWGSSRNQHQRNVGNHLWRFLGSHRSECHMQESWLFESYRSHMLLSIRRWIGGDYFRWRHMLGTRRQPSWLSARRYRAAQLWKRWTCRRGLYQYK